MKQFQAAYQNADSFRESVEAWRRWRVENNAGQALVHIFSDGADDGDVAYACTAVEELMPDGAEERKE